MPFRINRAFKRPEQILGGASRNLLYDAIGPQRPRPSTPEKRYGSSMPLSFDSPVPPRAAALAPAVEMQVLPRPVRQSSCANPLQIIQDWRFWGGFPRRGQAPMPFGFYVPRVDDPSGFIPAETVFQYIVTKFPTMPLHEQHLLVCYAGMPTTLAALQPQVIPKSPARKCPGILILEFDGVLTINNTIEPGGGYGPVNGYIHYLMQTCDSCAENIKDLATADDEEHERKFIVGTGRSILWGTLEQLLMYGTQIIIVSKNYDVELVLLHLMDKKLFGSVAQTKPSLLHNIHLVVYPMCQKDSFDTDTYPTSLYVGYAMRCLDPTIFSALDMLINYYSYHSSMETDKPVLELQAELNRYIKTPNQQDCEIRIYEVQAGAQFLAGGANGVKITGTTNPAASCWQPQNYQITQWKNVCCPRCPSAPQVIPQTEELSCQTCGCQLWSQQERDCLKQEVQGLLQAMHRSLRPDNIRDSGAFSESPLSAVMEAASEEVVYQVIANYSFDNPKQFQRVKWYLAVEKNSTRKIFAAPFGLTPEIIRDEKIAVRYCLSEIVGSGCIYSDLEDMFVCPTHGQPLIRLSADKYFLQQQRIIGLQCYSRRYLVRQDHFQRLLKKHDVSFYRYNMLRGIANFYLQPLVSKLSEGVAAAELYSLSSILAPQPSTRIIALPLRQCLQLAELLLVHLRKQRGVIDVDKIYGYSQYEGFDIAICPSIDCHAIFYQVSASIRNILSENDLCRSCKLHAVTILRGAPPRPAQILIPSLSSNQQHVERQLAMEAQIFHISAPLAGVIMPSSAEQALFPLPVVCGDIRHWVADSREAICEFGLLQQFSWRHSCMLKQLKTTQPVAAIIAMGVLLPNPKLDEALLAAHGKLVRCAGYSKLIVDNEIHLRVQQRFNAYFGAPLMPVSFDRLAMPSGVDEVAVCVFEFEAFLIEPILAPCNHVGSILNINPEENIQRNAKEFLLRYRETYPTALIAIICQTWDLALVERYLNVMQPGLAEQCIIITNPGSANGAVYRSSDAMRQLQYLYQALWTKRRWISDMALVHREVLILQEFISEFTIRISDLAPYLKLKIICEPNKFIWATDPKVNGGMPQRHNGKCVEVFYYQTALIGADPGWTRMTLG